MTIQSEQIEPGVLRLRMSNWRGRGVGYEASAYLLRGVLVDTGFPAVRAELLRAVRDLGPRGGVVTHWHEDHAGNVQALAALGLPLLLHPRCESTMRERPPIRMYRRVVWGRAPRLSLPLGEFDPAPLRVIATPGHTIDHQVVWDGERGIVASGDLFLGVKVRVAHLDESPQALLRSLREVAALQPRLLLDGHRGVVRNASQLLNAKIAWMEETVGRIRARLAEGTSEHQVAREVFGAEPLVGWASGGEYSHLSFVRAVRRES